MMHRHIAMFITHCGCLFVYAGSRSEEVVLIEISLQLVILVSVQAESD